MALNVYVLFTLELKYCITGLSDVTDKGKGEEELL
jgi:hypothetical protein